MMNSIKLFDVFITVMQTTIWYNNIFIIHTNLLLLLLIDGGRRPSIINNLLSAQIILYNTRVSIEVCDH